MMRVLRINAGIAARNQLLKSTWLIFVNILSSTGVNLSQR